MSVKDVFLDLVSYPTASDETTGTTPSTPGQKVLGAHIVEHMKSIGIADARMDEMGYVYAPFPPRRSGAPPWALSPTWTPTRRQRENIHPQVIENYDGGAIALGGSGLSLSPAAEPALLGHVGKDPYHHRRHHAAGRRRQGRRGGDSGGGRGNPAENKPHGTVKIGFTPDEEIGEGADHFDVEGFGCDYAYTVDGGQLGGLDYETFNAASAVVEVEGVSTHTGGAKGKMVNSMGVAMEFCALLPKGQVPELTEGREGFIHLDAIHGNVEHTVMQFLIRDHDKELFRQKKELMEKAAAYINAKYPTQPLALTLKDSYYNMREMIEPRMEIVENMERAMKENGVEPHSEPVRGGTDGARLSFMGLPCPNICTGGANAHGKTEYVVLEDMEKIKDIIKTAIYNVE